MVVKKTGDWKRARALLAAGPARVKQALGLALRREAEVLRRDIVQGLTRQAPGGEKLKPPSPLTLAARRLKKRGGTKSLIVRGDLRGAITTVTQGDRAFVGVRRRARDRADRPLVDIAQVQEYGAGPFVIPVTPAMRRFLHRLFAKAGEAGEGSQGHGRGVVIVTIPPRPFLRPAFHEYCRGAERRFRGEVAKILGWERR